MQAIGRQPQRAPDRASAHYERHLSEQTTLDRLMQQHAATFIAQAEDAAGAELPQFVNDAFDVFLECGILTQGCLCLHCGDCGHDKLAAFGCKRRGFCPLCWARQRQPVLRGAPWLASFGENCTGAPAPEIDARLCHTASGEASPTALPLARLAQNPLRGGHRLTKIEQSLRPRDTQSQHRQPVVARPALDARMIATSADFETGFYIGHAPHRRAFRFAVRKSGLRAGTTPAAPLASTHRVSTQIQRMKFAQNISSG